MLYNEAFGQELAYKFLDERILKIKNEGKPEFNQKYNELETRIKTYQKVA